MSTWGRWKDMKGSWCHGRPAEAGNRDCACSTVWLATRWSAAASRGLGAEGRVWGLSSHRLGVSRVDVTNRGVRNGERENQSESESAVGIAKGRKCHQQEAEMRGGQRSEEADRLHGREGQASVQSRLMGELAQVRQSLVMTKPCAQTGCVPSARAHRKCRSTNGAGQ